MTRRFFASDWKDNSDYDPNENETHTDLPIIDPIRYKAENAWNRGDIIQILATMEDEEPLLRVDIEAIEICACDQTKCNFEQVVEIIKNKKELYRTLKTKLSEVHAEIVIAYIEGSIKKIQAEV